MKSKVLNLDEKYSFGVRANSFKHISTKKNDMNTKSDTTGNIKTKSLNVLKVNHFYHYPRESLIYQHEFSKTRKYQQKIAGFLGQLIQEEGHVSDQSFVKCFALFSDSFSNLYGHIQRSFAPRPSCKSNASQVLQLKLKILNLLQTEIATVKILMFLTYSR